MQSYAVLIVLTLPPFLLLYQPADGLSFYSPQDGSFFKSHSGIPDVPDDIPDGARYVGLGYNNITVLRENDFSRLAQCTNVNLWWNSIANIETGSFNGLYLCEELFLANNLLTEVRYGMFLGLESLKKLHLNDNQIGTIKDGTFAGLVHLEELWFSNNKLKVLQYKMLRGVTNLKVLKLWGNEIESIESGTFSGPVNLKELWLAENALKEIRYDVFIGLDNLEQLYLGWNKISRLEDDAFLSLSNLTILDLQFNELTELGGRSLIGLDSLQTLTLKNNLLPTLRVHALVALPRPLALALGGNPVRCDCELCWLWEEGRNRTVTWEGTSQTDGKPRCLGGEKWDDWTCSSQDAHCSDPGIPTNGTRRGNAPYTCNSVVTYSCEDGYWLAGDPALSCGNNGTWSSAKPECHLKRNSVLRTSSPPITSSRPNNVTLWVGLIVGVAIACSVISVIFTSCVCRHVTRRQKEPNFPEFTPPQHVLNEYEVLPTISRAEDSFIFPSFKVFNSFSNRTTAC